MPKEDSREKSFRVRLTEEEREMLDRVATRDGLTSSDWVRQAVRRAHAELPSKAKGKR